jgi:hypothetical protein
LVKGGSTQKKKNRKEMSRKEREEYLNAWAKTMPKKQAKKAKKLGNSKRVHMKKCGFDMQFLSGLTIGDWESVTQRVITGDRPFQFYRDPNTFRKVKVNDKVKIHCGNAVKWDLVGRIATVIQRKDRLEGAAGDAGMFYYKLQLDDDDDDDDEGMATAESRLARAMFGGVTVVIHEGNLEVL